jgi:two-component system cell cycle sensor histidine kinase/response regulator CckA
MSQETSGPLYEELHALRRRVVELERAEHGPGRCPPLPDQAEEQLRQSEERYRSIAEDSLQGIAIQQDGFFRYANGALARMFGYASPEELIGCPWEVLVVPEDRPVLAGRVAAGLGGQDVPRHHGWRGLRKDGTTLWAESALSVIPWQGRPAILSFVIDVSERRRAEEALRERQALLQNVLAHIPLAVFWKDRLGAYLGCNEQFARDVGLPCPAAVVGKTDLDLPGTREEAEGVRRSDAAVLASGRPLLNVEETRRRPDGAQSLLLTSKVPLRDAKGEVLGVLGIHADVTEQRRLQEQLRQSQKLEAVGRLAGGVAHEFNNLLTALAGHAELLQGALQADDALREHVAEIRKAADRAAALTRQLLALGRKQVATPAPLDLNAVVSGLEGILRGLVGEDVTLTTRTAPGLWLIWADAGQLEQVLINLVVNARDAVPGGGEITVETRNVPHAGPGGNGPCVLLAVRDTGCGMDRATRERLFEPFFTTKGVGKGTGLGLSTVYGIVKQSGGHIEVESEPGRGSSFKVSLPRLDGDGQGQAEPAPAAPERGGETVLLVEDEDMVRNLARRILRMQGYKVLEARHGVEALEVAERHGEPIHLLLTDVVMPLLGGRQLADRLLPQRPGLKVLYMSGYADDAVLRHGVFEAEVDFLQKPFSPDVLVRKLREVLGS